MELFGLRLKALRQSKGLTQQQLADRLNIVSASVSGYEKNSFYPSVEVLSQICLYFGVSADYMLGLSD
ncbi:MAG: helix-turn-helix domain-containing protein, partial [Oscillospiraceae bacterium]|nr:helix-turn-helix domain-containing protein [Oscillospiraceae bacterium]